MWTFIAGLGTKLQAYLAIAGAVIVAVGIAFLKGRSAGKSAEIGAIQRETQKVDQKFQRIDAAPVDFDAALGKLRDRSK